MMILTWSANCDPPPPSRSQIQGEKMAVEGIRYRGVFGTISTMIRTEGPRSLYNGLVAGLQRQLCFASIRIGLYDNVKNFYTGGKDSESMFRQSAKKKQKKQTQLSLVKVQTPQWGCCHLLSDSFKYRLQNRMCLLGNPTWQEPAYSISDKRNWQILPEKRSPEPTRGDRRSTASALSN